MTPMRARRDLLLAALAAPLIPCPALADILPRSDAVEVAPGLFVLPGVEEEASRTNLNAIANTGFVIGRDAVAVIDAGGSLPHGQRLRRAIEAVTPLPVRHLILTHVHPDHVLGAAGFADLAPDVVGHARLPEALAVRHESYLRGLARDVGAAAMGSGALSPTRLVADRLELDLGGRVIELHAHGPAHSHADLSVVDRATATLWCADLLFQRHIPTLDGSLPGWIGTLAALRSTPAARAVPGHGPPAVPWPAGADNTLRYLRALLDGARAAVAGGVGIGDAPSRVAVEEAARWRLAELHHGRNVTTAYRELEWE
jgi:quinoprotein relay system zinc metallohydrolase 2